MARFSIVEASSNVQRITAAAALLLLTGLSLTSLGGSGRWSTAAASTALQAVHLLAPDAVGPTPVAERFLRPTRELYERLLADPALLDATPSLADEFVAAPWLLPPRTRHLAYAGVTGLDEILALRSQVQPGHNKTISLLASSLHEPSQQVMTLNCVYGLVKFGGVTNYVVAVWTPEALKVCADLNLPCADIKPLLDSHAYITEDKRGGNRATWFKPIVAQYALQRGFVVHVTDTDIGYAAKPVWASYLALLEDPPADAAFQNEEMAMGPINTGNFVVLPTPGGIRFMEGWMAGLERGIVEDFNDQIWIVNFMPARNEVFEICRSRQNCLRLYDQLAETNRTGLPVVRTYMAAYWAYTYVDFCTLVKPDPPVIDLCDWQVLYVHAYCTGGLEKNQVLANQTLWFMDDDKGICAPQLGSESKAASCMPRFWRLPKHELPVTRCAADMSLFHKRPNFQE